MNNSRFPELTQEYETQKAFFECQPATIQRFLESQAPAIANAMITKTSRAVFTLPDRLAACGMGSEPMIVVPETWRRNEVRDLIRRNVRKPLLQRLDELEKSADEAIQLATGLLRYTTVTCMVERLLPAGRAVRYRCDGEEQIPTIPVEDELLESAITQASDAIVENGANEGARGSLQTPFVPAARRFFLPQWVAFDDQGKLLAGSAGEAASYVRSMQQYVWVLHHALTLAPYISASKEFQRRRSGILGQLINQGRALARFRTEEIICEIKRRAERHTLNRGLSITLPYFDDQSLELESDHLDVIPGGRILFIPAFVVRAAAGEQAKVAQDTRLNNSTRRHLLSLLKAVETAFRA